MNKKTLRILHAPIIACNQAAELSRALNKIKNVRSRYMLFGDKEHSWRLSSGVDYDLHLDGSSKITKIIKQGFFFIWSLFNFDIFHFHSHISLLHPTHWDVPILKFFGKKIYMSYWGCDVRRRSLDLKYKTNICAVCPGFDCREKWKEAQIKYFTDKANLQISHMPESLEFVPGSIFMPTCINVNYWRPLPKKSKDKTIRVMHPVGDSSYRGAMKGTPAIKEAVETLKKEGYDVDFLFFDKLPHKDMRKNYADADIVVEQLHAGWHGSTGLEAMACGKPVITYLREDLIKYMPEIPIISADVDTITEELRKLVKDKKLRQTLGKKSRQYVLKFHDSKIVAQKMLEIYQKT